MVLEIPEMLVIVELMEMWLLTNACVFLCFYGSLHYKPSISSRHRVDSCRWGTLASPANLAHQHLVALPWANCFTYVFVLVHW